MPIDSSLPQKAEKSYRHLITNSTKVCDVTKVTVPTRACIKINYISILTQFIVLVKLINLHIVYNWYSITTIYLFIPQEAIRG